MDDDVLMRLVDWAYLHASEGHTWPSTQTKIALVALAKERAPGPQDAEVMKIGPRKSAPR